MLIPEVGASFLVFPSTPPKGSTLKAAGSRRGLSPIRRRWQRRRWAAGVCRAKSSRAPVPNDRRGTDRPKKTDRGADRVAPVGTCWRPGVAKVDPFDRGVFLGLVEIHHFWRGTPPITPKGAVRKTCPVGSTELFDVFLGYPKKRLNKRGGQRKASQFLGFSQF